MNKKEIEESNKTIKNPEPVQLSDEAITNLVNYVLTLKQIHVRLVMEGYIIEPGRIYKPENLKKEGE